jgi:hypothetical protein
MNRAISGWLNVVGPPDGIEARPTPGSHEGGQRAELEGRRDRSLLETGRSHARCIGIPTAGYRGHRYLLRVDELGSESEPDVNKKARFKLHALICLGNLPAYVRLPK